MRPKTSFDLWAETGEDITVSVAAVKTRLENIENQIVRIPHHVDNMELADLNKTAAELMLELEQDLVKLLDIDFERICDNGFENEFQEFYGV